VRRAAWIAVALLAVPVTAGAHGPDGFVVPGGLWGAWNWDPWVLGGVWLTAWLYSRGVERLWRRAGTGRGVRRWETACFAGGTVALLAALVSPLDALGGALFSAHMLQHVVLMMVAAPLLVLGRPLVPLLWALPPGWRRRLGGVARRPAVRGAWGFLAHPLAAWSLHAAAIWLWHLPGLYQATLSSQAVHVLQHLSFFGTALLFWWATVEFGRRRRGFALGSLFVFTTMVQSSLLGALLTFSMIPWYPAYAGRTRVWGLTPLEDQQLGGLVMWIPPGLVYLAAVLTLIGIGLGPAAAGARGRSAGGARLAALAPGQPPRGSGADA
jgi:putative membrane protein